MIGEIEGELKEDIENINSFLKNSENEYSIKLENFLVLGEKYSYNIKNKIFQFSYILFDENHNEINKIRISIENI